MLNTTRDTTGQRTHEPNSADASHSIRHVTSQVHSTLKTPSFKHWLSALSA